MMEAELFRALCLPTLEFAPSPMLPCDALDPEEGMFVLADQLYWEQDLAYTS